MTKDRTERKRKISDSKAEIEMKVTKMDKKERKRKSSETKLETVIDSSDNSNKKKLKKDKTLAVSDKSEATVNNKSGKVGVKSKEAKHKKLQQNSLSDSDSGVEVKQSRLQVRTRYIYRDEICSLCKCSIGICEKCSSRSAFSQV